MYSIYCTYMKGDFKILLLLHFFNPILHLSPNCVQNSYKSIFFCRTNPNSCQIVVCNSFIFRNMEMRYWNPWHANVWCQNCKSNNLVSLFVLPVLHLLIYSKTEGKISKPFLTCDDYQYKHDLTQSSLILRVAFFCPLLLPSLGHGSSSMVDRPAEQKSGEKPNCLRIRLSLIK